MRRIIMDEIDLARNAEVRLVNRVARCFSKRSDKNPGDKAGGCNKAQQDCLTVDDPSWQPDRIRLRPFLQRVFYR